MSLMKLAPETVRLRRVAKAYAAGEFSQIEYRQARREVIDNFLPDRVGFDDTQRRVEQPVLDTRSPVVSLQPTPVFWPRLLFFSVLLLATLAAANLAFAARIGPVSERDPNPATSARFPVSEVRIADFQPYPGVLQESVEAVIEQSLGAVRKRDVEGQHGFTPAELEEVGRFLNAVGVHSKRVALTGADARDLADMIQSQKERRGVSLVQLEEIAGNVQRFYRERGYFLAIAYLPSQEVQDGIVDIRVLPGTLGSITASEGAPPFLTERFIGALGQPVTRQLVDERLYEINQLPGLKAQAAFDPGNEVGETRLNLNVVEQNAWSTRARLDNHGDQATGTERITVAGSWLNPRGAGDVMSIGLLSSLNPSNQTYGYAEYATPLDSRYRIRARIGNNDFTSGRELELEGDSFLADFTAARTLARSRSRSMTIGLGLKYHGLSWDEGPRQKVTFLDGTLSSHRVWDTQRIAADARIGFAAGQIGDDTFSGQEDNFWRLSFDAMAWTPVDLGVLPGQQKLAVKLIGQLADSQLPSTLRLGLGGARYARGFSRDALLIDSGVIVGLDLRIPVGLGELVLFGDSAYGEGQNELQPMWGHLTSAGIGWDAELGASFVSRMSWAVPVAAKGTGGLEDDGPRFYWSLQYVH